MTTHSEQRLLNIEVYWFAVLFNDLEQLGSANVEQFRYPMREILTARKNGTWDESNDRQLRELTGVVRRPGEKVNEAISDWFGIVANCRKGGKVDYQELAIQRMRVKQEKEI